MNDLDLPPRRPLPPEIRDRLRERIDAAAPRAGRFRAPLAAAAGVAVLAAGAVIVAQSVAGSPDGFTPGAPTSTTAAPGGSELDRCWAAVVTAGKANRYPDRAQWREVVSTDSDTSRVTAFRAAGKPVFCQTMARTVVVSDPNAEPALAPGTGTGSLLATNIGGLGGVADPSWTRVGVEIHDQSGSDTMTTATAKDGLFVVAGWSDRAVRTRVYDQIDDDPARLDTAAMLPTAPPPPVSVVDRPADAPPQDVEFLSTCLGKADPAAPDAHLWQPGASVATDLSTAMVARNADKFGVCYHNATSDRSHDDYTFEPVDTPRAVDPVSRVHAQLTLNSSDDDRPLVLGVLPEQATSLRLEFDGGTKIDADVANGSFAALLPPRSIHDSGQPVDGMKLVHAVARDARGKVVYEGPVS